MGRYFSTKSIEKEVNRGAATAKLMGEERIGETDWVLA